MNKNEWQEHDVARVLEQFDPQPSARFHQRMQSQPWMAQTMTTRTHGAPTRTPNRRWMPAAGLLALMLCAGLVIVTPPLRAFAQDILQVFVRAPTEALTVAELEANAPPLEESQDGLSLVEAEQRAGFKLWTPSIVPEKHHFNQATYVPSEEMVTSLYVAADAPVVDLGQYSQLVLAQQPARRAASSRSMFPVGVAAPIESVQIDGMSGQYVEGSWCGAGPDPETPLQWCGSSSARTLRWQRDEWMFTLAALDMNASLPSLSREQLIAVAATLVPSGE